MEDQLNLDHVSPATRLLEKRRQMFEVQEALDAQKEEFGRREEAFRRREEALRRKDLELQESLIRFNKFLQENESKRNRAEKRAQEEARLRKHKESEIEKLKRQLRDMRDQSEELARTVQANMKFQDFLELVQESVPEDYPEISDLLNRYRTLRDANTRLLKRQDKQELLAEETRNQYRTFTKEKTNEILNFNNEIASLQKKLEVVEGHVASKELELEGATRLASDKTLELGQVLLGVENLLERCSGKRHGSILKHKESSKEQPADRKELGELSQSELTKKVYTSLRDLDVIANYLADFKSVCDGHDGPKLPTKMFGSVQT